MTCVCIDLRFDKQQCLESIKAEHKRLGEPILKFRNMSFSSVRTKAVELLANPDRFQQEAWAQ